MSISVDINSKPAAELLRRAPEALARACIRGSVRALDRYRGFHRRRRMSRRSDAERVGVYGTSTGSGIKNDRRFPVKELAPAGPAAGLEGAGAEIRTRDLIIRQLEHGAVRRPKVVRAMAVPFSRYLRRGRPEARLVRLRKEKKLVLIKDRQGKAYLGERRAPRVGSREYFSDLHGSRVHGFLRLYFHLQPFITVPPRLEFEKLFISEYRSQTLREINRAMAEELKRL